MAQVGRPTSIKSGETMENTKGVRTVHAAEDCPQCRKLIITIAELERDLKAHKELAEKVANINAGLLSKRMSGEKR